RLAGRTYRRSHASSKFGIFQIWDEVRRQPCEPVVVGTALARGASSHLAEVRPMLAQKGLFSLALVVAIGACSDQPTSPKPLVPTDGPAYQFERGTGLTVKNVTSTPIPLLGNVEFNGDLVIT